MLSPSTFEALNEELSWFITSPEIRVLHIAVGGDERPIALEQVRFAEGHGCNRSPFFVLEDAFTGGDPGWLVRADRARVGHQARREAMAREGYALSALPEGQARTEGVRAFVEVLREALAAQANVRELDGLVVVLAPAVLEAPDAFARAAPGAPGLTGPGARARDRPRARCHGVRRADEVVRGWSHVRPVQLRR